MQLDSLSLLLERPLAGFVETPCFLQTAHELGLHYLHFSQQFGSSKFPGQHPVTICLRHSRNFLAECSKLSHVPPANQFQRSKRKNV